MLFNFVRLVGSLLLSRTQVLLVKVDLLQCLRGVSAIGEESDYAYALSCQDNENSAQPKSQASEWSRSIMTDQEEIKANSAD